MLQTIGLHSGATLTLRTFESAVGYFGFFRPQFEQSLWPLVPQWLTAS